MIKLKPKHGEWWLGKWSGTNYNAVMQYNSNTDQWYENGLETFETEHSFKPVNRLYEKCDIARLEQENAELREALLKNEEFITWLIENLPADVLDNIDKQLSEVTKRNLKALSKK